MDVTAPLGPAAAHGGEARRLPSAQIAPHRADVASWRTLNALHQRMHEDLSAALRPTGLTLVEFAVLDILEEQVDGHLRMQDVARVAGLTTGAATRLAKRLEDRGLLVRVLCAYDRRGIFTELTDQGRQLLATARDAHDAAVSSGFGDAATIDVLATLAASLRKP